jgi:hypothetical protein
MDDKQSKLDRIHLLFQQRMELDREIESLRTEINDIEDKEYQWVQSQ